MEEVKKEIENSVTVQSGSRIITVEEQLRNQIKMVIDGASFDLRFCANAFGISNDELESNFFIKYVESLKSNAKDKKYIDILEV
jgi:stage III sporulation protein SpoIIIAA